MEPYLFDHEQRSMSLSASLSARGISVMPVVQSFSGNPGGRCNPRRIKGDAQMANVRRMDITQKLALFCLRVQWGQQETIHLVPAKPLFYNFRSDLFGEAHV